MPSALLSDHRSICLELRTSPETSISQPGYCSDLYLYDMAAARFNFLLHISLIYPARIEFLPQVSAFTLNVIAILIVSVQHWGHWRLAKTYLSFQLYIYSTPPTAISAPNTSSVLPMTVCLTLCQYRSFLCENIWWHNAQVWAWTVYSGTELPITLKSSFESQLTLVVRLDITADGLLWVDNVPSKVSARSQGREGCLRATRAKERVHATPHTVSQHSNSFFRIIHPSRHNLLSFSVSFITVGSLDSGYWHIVLLVVCLPHFHSACFTYQNHGQVMSIRLLHVQKCYGYWFVLYLIFVETLCLESMYADVVQAESSDCDTCDYHCCPHCVSIVVGINQRFINISLCDFIGADIPFNRNSMLHDSTFS